MVLHDLVPPGPPQNLTAQDIGSTFVTLNWLPPKASGDVRYKVYIQTNQSYEVAIFYKEVEITSVHITDLKSSTDYMITVAVQSVKFTFDSDNNASITVRTANEATGKLIDVLGIM